MSEADLTQLGKKLDERYRHTDISKNIAGGYYDMLVEHGVIQKKAPLKIDDSSVDSKKIKKRSEAVTKQDFPRPKIGKNDFSSKAISDSLFDAIFFDRYSMLKSMLTADSIKDSALTKNTEGENPLMYASKFQRVDVVEDLLLLVSRDDQALAVDNDGRNALMNAAASGCTPIVKLLLNLESAETQAVVKNKFGINALMVAVSNEHVDIVELLLSLMSADHQVTARSIEEKNAMDLARELKNEAIINILKKFQ